MFLKSLRISNNDSVLREIIFRKGVNFIVDETPEEDAENTKTGNNVGKTTVLRLVDYCLGADGNSIYKDPEFKKQTNNSVEDFLKNENIVIEIVLSHDLNVSESNSIVIRRNFLVRGKKIQEINGNNILNDGEFDRELKKLVFNTNVEKPTFRQIVSKNIRNEKNKIANIVNVLSPFTKPEEYEALFLFWLGIDTNLNSKKQSLVEEKKNEEKFQKRLKTEGEQSSILQRLVVVGEMLTALNKKKNEFYMNDNYKEDIDSLNNVKSKLSILSTKIMSLEMRRQLIIESKEKLEAEFVSIDTNQIKELYDRVKSFIPDVHVEFEGVVSFHNNLIKEKTKYVTKELPNLENEIKEKRNALDMLVLNEKELSKRIKKSGFTDDFEYLILEMNKLSEMKGSLEERKRIWEDSLTKSKRIEEELLQVNEFIVSNDSLIQKRIIEFNKFFTKLSLRLYGEAYILSSTKNQNYSLVVTTFENNPGTGKKKGQIAAFDFAYMLFADSIGIPCLHFVMHDQLETVHINQIFTLIEVGNELNGQYIVPILKDKIRLSDNVDNYIVLALSQNDKLFKL